MKTPKDTRLTCSHCGVKTWSQDYASFAREHARPDGRNCLKAREAAKAANAAKGSKVIALKKPKLGRGAKSALKKSAAHFGGLILGRIKCPECGDNGPHDDNGSFGDELAFCCRACGTHFEPEALEL